VDLPPLVRRWFWYSRLKCFLGCKSVDAHPHRLRQTFSGSFFEPLIILFSPSPPDFFFATQYTEDSLRAARARLLPFCYSNFSLVRIPLSLPLHPSGLGPRFFLQFSPPPTSCTSDDRPLVLSDHLASMFSLPPPPLPKPWFSVRFFP